jgi:hypothetical protein
MPVILGTWKVEIEETRFKASQDKKVSKTLF